MMRSVVQSSQRAVFYFYLFHSIDIPSPSYNYSTTTSTTSLLTNSSAVNCTLPGVGARFQGHLVSFFSCSSVFCPTVAFPTAADIDVATSQRTAPTLPMQFELGSVREGSGRICLDKPGTTAAP